MNTRRSFLSQILRAGVASMALPSAVTYARRWKAPRPNSGKMIWVLDWHTIKPCIIDPITNKIVILEPHHSSVERWGVGQYFINCRFEKP